MKRLAVLILCSVFVGCVATPPRPQRTPLEIRELQTRDFGTVDTRMVMKALLNVLQDEGFTTKNAVTDLGLVTATKEENAFDRRGALLRSVFAGPDATWPQTVVVEATANVTEFGRDTRVRVSFQRKTIDNHGATMEVEEVDDALLYQAFFTKLDQGIFYQRERL